MSTVRRGYDSWADSGATGAEHGSGQWVQIASTTRRGFVFMPLKGVRGRTVLSAVLAPHVAGTWASQDVTVQRVAADWDAATLNWGNQPGVVGATVTVATGAHADGEQFSATVTDLIQAVANGAAWYGFRIVTSEASAQKLYAFDSGEPSWTLTLELSDAPEQPSDLAPNGGSVSESEPIWSWDFTDLGGTSTEQAAFKVQADPAADEISPNFDSGWVTDTDPQYDSSVGSYAGPSSGGSDQWRVMVRDGDGLESVWSDWAPFTYTPKQTLTIDNPGVAGLIYDPTPPIEAHLSAGTLRAFRIRITKGSDRTVILYDSGIQPASHATDIEWTLPLRYQGRRIFHDDTNYQVNVRAWDTVDRAEGVVGDTTYVEQWRTFTFDNDATVTAPVLVSVGSYLGSPRMQFVATRSVDPDAWEIRRNGKFYIRLPNSAFTESPSSTFTWIDGGYSDPRESATWTIRAIVGGRRSAASNAIVAQTTPEGVWLIRNQSDMVCLDGVASVDGFRTLDRRATYKPINVGYDVDIITGQEGVSGPFEGEISTGSLQTVSAALATLEAIKDEPMRSFRMVWATKSIPVKLRHLTALPASDYRTNSQKHKVTFEFWQVGDLDDLIED